MSPRGTDDDPVPPGLVLDLDEAFRVPAGPGGRPIRAQGDRAAPGLQDELATVIRILHSRLGFDEGGVP